MNYISKYKLISAINNNSDGLPDRKELLCTVDRNRIFKKIKTKYSDSNIIDDFFITEESIEEEHWAKLPDQVKKKLSKLNSQLKRGRKVEYVAKALEAFKLKYPRVPAIYNYLGIAYQRAGQEKKYIDVLFETREKFPDYLFGKISLAEYYLSLDGGYKEIPALFDKKYEITQHFPSGTSCFHLSEARSFYYVTGRYFALAGNIEMAYKSYFLLSDLDINHITTETLGQEIIAYELSILYRKRHVSPKRGYL
jgi:hypothetical protein